jgi:hypothetical protein
MPATSRAEHSPARGPGEIDDHDLRVALLDDLDAEDPLAAEPQQALE